jgi:hypothetical protein
VNFDTKDAKSFIISLYADTPTPRRSRDTMVPPPRITILPPTHRYRTDSSRAAPEPVPQPFPQAMRPGDDGDREGIRGGGDDFARRHAARMDTVGAQQPVWKLLGL